MGKEMKATQYRMTLANNLTRIIQQTGYSQAEIARQMGVSTSALSSWCRGARYPRADQLVALASILNVSESELTEDVSAKDDYLLGLSRGALAVARQYDQLDALGQEVVRFVVDAEFQRTKQ